MVFLDPELVHIESVAFVRQASNLAHRNPLAPDALSLLTSYRGRFAPEFEYEQWAIQWRDHTHSYFLDLAEQASRARIASGQSPEATAILRHALTVDPEALELKPLMAAALHLSGSQAAAKHLYGQYMRESEREYGVAPGTLSSLLRSLGFPERGPLES
jgi:two-component SAPR family response regulator